MCRQQRFSVVAYQQTVTIVKVAVWALRVCPNGITWAISRLKYTFDKFATVFVLTLDTFLCWSISYIGDCFCFYDCSVEQPNDHALDYFHETHVIFLMHSDRNHMQKKRWHFKNFLSWVLNCGNVLAVKNTRKVFWESILKFLTVTVFFTDFSRFFRLVTA